MPVGSESVKPCPRPTNSRPEDFPGAGVGDVLEERRERLGQLRTGRSGLGPLNRTIDAFVAVAADTQLSFDFLTHPDGAHAFDVLNDVPRSKGIIESTLQSSRAT